MTRKPGALQAVDVVDLGAEDELHADLVDDHRDAVDLEDVVVVLRLVEGERVLEAGATAAANRDAQRLTLGVGLGAEQLADLLGGLVGQRDRCSVAVSVTSQSVAVAPQVVGQFEMHSHAAPDLPSFV